MNSDPYSRSQTGSEPSPFPTALLLFLILVAALGGAMSISTKSFWIDEANAAWRAMQPDWGQFTFTMRELKGSDLQMPFYLGYLWVWEKLVPRTEYWLRLGNLPWFVLGQVMWLVGFRRNRVLAITAFLASLIHPMVWFYMDEARPYAMQYSLSVVVIVALTNLILDGGAILAWYACLTGAIAVLAGTSMLAMPVAGLAWLSGLFFVWRKKDGPIKPVIVALSAASLLMLGLWTLYYLWSLSIGSGGSPAFKTSAATVAFIGYEFLGFSGLGPGRNDLRSGIGALKEFAPALGAMALSVVIAAVASLMVLRRPGRMPSKILLGVIAVIAVPAVMVVGVGFLKEFRVLGRHLIFALPLLILLVAFVVQRGAQQGRWWIYWTFAPLACVWLISSLSLRFAPRHAKDDYRGAAALAVAALERGDTVWWVADPAAAEYYGVPSAKATAQAVSGKAISMMCVAQLPPVPKGTALTVVLSKPDVFDIHGTVTAFVGMNTPESVVTLPSFQVCRIVPSRAP